MPGRAILEAPPRALVRDLGWYLAERIVRRKDVYQTVPRPNLISFLTPAFNTPPEFLNTLARAIFRQDLSNCFEWILLDNGSNQKRTVRSLAKIARHPSVRFSRVEDNIGIIGGMRWCLEQARGTYVVPVDSDDWLTPDCARILSAFIEINGFPPILYTNEDMVDGQRHFMTYAKPDWDPVLFSYSCFIAHLTAFRRELALEMGCYDDRQVEGSHDWDTFIRFSNAGHVPLHIPEVLYSWRIHPESTSANYKVKPVIFASQRSALVKFASARTTQHAYAVERDPLFGEAPDWRYSATNLPRKLPIVGIVMGDAPAPDHMDRFERTLRLSAPPTIETLARTVQALSDDTAFVHLFDASCRLLNDEWIREAIGLFDLHPDAAVIGGRLHDHTKIVCSGYVFGFGEPIFCPDKGRNVEGSGYFAQMWKARSVAAVSPRHCLVRLKFLRDVLGALPDQATLSYLGAWLGAAARAAGKRIIYTPHMEAITTQDWDIEVSAEQRRRLVARYGLWLRDRVGYASGLKRQPSQEYGLGTEDVFPERPSYAEWITWQIEDRQREMPKVPHSISLSLLTTVYEKTDHALFGELSQSIAAQTSRPLEWIVLAHGPISGELDCRLQALTANGGATVYRLDQNRGITGGLRYCIDQAKGDWVFPVDADDLLTDDAVSLICKTISEKRDCKIIYSDEDALIDGRFQAPCLRPDFDPVLLACQSYVNHAIVFHREVGRTLQVYSDQGADFAQDWDTMRRFWRAGHQPIHLSEIIYRWRKHVSSISQSGNTFEGSFQSIRHYLECIRRDAEVPELYEVADCPIHLGIGDLHLRRKPISSPSIVDVRLARGAASTELPATDLNLEMSRSLDSDRGTDQLDRLSETVKGAGAEFVLLHGRGAVCRDQDGIWDAVKHLELFDDVAVASGRLIGSNGTVLFGCPVHLSDGKLVDPMVGRPADDAGHYSIGLKPHTISVPCLDLLLTRRTNLLDALSARPPNVSLRNLGCWLGVHAALRGTRVAYVPLFRAEVADPRRLAGDRGEALACAWLWMSKHAGLTGGARLGLAASHAATFLFQ